MGETTAPAPAPTTTPAARPAAHHDAWLDRRWRLTGAVIGLAVLVVAVVTVLTGSQRGTFGDLLGAVADGDVSQVQVVGRVDDGTWTGTRTVEVHWHDWRDRYAEVRVVRGSEVGAAGDGTYVTAQDPRDVLLAIDPDLLVVRSDTWPPSGASFADWQVDGTVAIACVVAWLTVLFLLVGGPEPRRATRWAWFWIWFLGTPLGALAFLLFGGPLARGPIHPSARRLTGGWAFLAAWILLAGWRQGMQG